MAPNETPAQISLSELLRKLIQLGGSDLHITTGSAPQVRVDGHLGPLDGYRLLSAADTKQLAYSVLTDAQKHRFEEGLELDFSFGVKGLSRFRANLFNQRGAVGAVFRAIPYEIKPFDELGLPPVVKQLCDKPRGLILVTGPTGSGKSTTLAAMVDKINRDRREHILTIEDPIEFLHNHKNCLVNQREVNADTLGFAQALRTALRQDPDVVLVGEMRDLETIESALRIAETGHLTLATLHTNSAVRNLIREDKVHQIYSMMQTGQDKYGMQTFNQSLATLYHKRQITLETALQRSSNVDELRELIERGSGVNSANGGPKHPSPYAQARPIGTRPSPNS